MKALWKKFQVSAIAVSVCMLILGIVMLVWPEISAVTICDPWRAVRRSRCVQAGSLLPAGICGGVLPV